MTRSLAQAVCAKFGAHHQCCRHEDGDMRCSDEWVEAPAAAIADFVEKWFASTGEDD